MEKLKTILDLEPSSDEYDPIAHLRMKADSINSSQGFLKDYDCRLCKNRGHFARVDGDRLVACDCKCLEIRRSVARMKESGLEKIIRDCTLDKFIAEEGWQKTMKEAAQRFAKDPKGFFMLCGQSGCGKTHLCTGICRELLLTGKKVRYMLWRDEIVRIKNGESGVLEEFKQADVLYIDDLFKTGKQDDAVKPTSADINYAFELINARYNDPEKITILSSELTQDELLDVDEATFGRIYERGTVLTIGRNRQRNYRLRKAAII